MSREADAALALRLLGLLDLTNLEANCGPAEIKQLVARAVGEPAPVAAVCLWPQFVSEASRALRDTGVTVATVINFPAGGEDLERVLEDMEEALGDGAQEIDLVLPYKAFLRGETALATDMVREAKGVVGDRRLLKVILETGAFSDTDSIAAASRLAIGAGADFLKTSTGKIAVSATPEAARVMIGEIARAGRRVGFKAAGGIRTVGDAALYLRIAEEAMGAGWATRDTFRIGASSLHAALATAVTGTAPAAPQKGSY
ncbi:deoxyribose-phosphate aldolase [Alsobacter sp. R-9]